MLGLFFRAQRLIGLPLGFFLVWREFFGQFFGFGKVEPGSSALLRAHRHPFIHAAVHDRLVSSRQIGVVFGNFEPFAFLCFADAIPARSQRLQVLLLLRVEFGPTRF